MRTKVEIEQENFCFGIIIQSIDCHSCMWQIGMGMSGQEKPYKLMGQDC